MKDRRVRTIRAAAVAPDQTFALTLVRGQYKSD